MTKQITLVNKGSLGHHYDVFVFTIEGSSIKFKKDKVKSYDTAIRLKKDVIGEVIDRGQKAPLTTKDLPAVLTEINRLRAKNGHTGEFVLEADGCGDSFFLRTVFKAAA